MASNITCYPVLMVNWHRFEDLFGVNGSCRCLVRYLKISEFKRLKGLDNNFLMDEMVRRGQTQGILAVEDNHPIGWAAIGKCSGYSALSRSRILKKNDDQPVWFIICFFVRKTYQKKGICNALIIACITYVEKQGGRLLEAYPVDPVVDKVPDVFALTGFALAFRKDGFTGINQRSPARLIMRLSIPGQSS